MKTKVNDTLASLFVNYRASLPDCYRWEDEKDRWRELVFCILTELSGLEEEACREIVTSLTDLGLLEPEALALATSGGKPTLENPAAARFVDVLVVKGAGKTHAERTVAAVCEVCRDIETKHGKLQRFLRSYAERMLDDLDRSFSFSKLGAQAERRILTRWLQNVLEMPIPISSPEVEAFCKKYKCTLDQLVNAADELDVNVAVVDDLIKLHMLDTDHKLRA